MAISRIPLLLAAAFAIAGCDGGGGSSEPPPPPAPPDPLAAYKDQTVQWGSCNQYFFETGSSTEASNYRAKLGDRVQCADIKAPLDYQNPDGLQISLSMLRVRAVESPEAKPNLFFNPGGPGEDGQTSSLLFSMLLSHGNEDSALGKKYKEVSDSYNFVGFSPRGVGASTRITCAGNELIYEIDGTKWGENAQNIRKITDTARYTATNCQKNPVSGYIHTDATARDMDLMRHLLGDEKLHYYGTSYGTWLGFWYAGMFPERIGPMVLDSNMNFNQSIHSAAIRYTNGQIHTFLEYIAPYAARHDTILGMGTSVESIVNDLNAIGHKTNQALLNIGGSFRAEREGIPAYLSAIKAAVETQKLIDQGKTLDEMESILSNGKHMGDEAIDQIFKQQAASMVQNLRYLEDPRAYTEPEYFSLDNSTSVWNTVVCNDEPLQNKDQTFWVDTGFDMAKSLPIAGNGIANQPCLYWNRQEGIAKPSMDSLKDAPLLMLQSEFDVPTPLSGAMETFEKLPAANMVRIQNEGAHGLMVYQTECVDLTVMNYLLGTTPSQRLIECQGKPLALDEKKLQDKALKTAARTDARPASNFEDPELAETLIAKLRDAARL